MWAGNMIEDKKMSKLVNIIYSKIKLECETPADAAELLLTLHVYLYLNQSKDHSNIEEYVEEYVKMFETYYYILKDLNKEKLQ